MIRITLSLDNKTAARMKAAAKAAGISRSQWVSNLIQEKTSTEWPASVARLIGTWADMPTVEELRKGEPGDIPRQSLEDDSV
jgi:hypothetical protein